MQPAMSEVCQVVNLASGCLSHARAEHVRAHNGA